MSATLVSATCRASPIFAKLNFFGVYYTLYSSTLAANSNLVSRVCPILNKAAHFATQKERIMEEICCCRGENFIARDYGRAAGEMKKKEYIRITMELYFQETFHKERK